MSQVQISIAEKPLLRFLCDGGEFSPETCEHFIADFLKVALRDGEVRAAASTYGFSSQELCIVFTTMQFAHPAECLDIGGPSLLPTLVFMEPARLESLGRLAKKFETEGLPREKAIVKAANEVADDIYAAHRDAGKVIAFADLKRQASAKSGFGIWILGIATIVIFVLLIRTC